MKRITKEEAIQILSTRDAHGVLCGYTSGVTEALDMAVEALSSQQTNLISKTGAIDELRHLIPYKKYHRGKWVYLLEKKEVFKALSALPTVSATKKLNNQIHLCDSCKYDYPNCPSENEDVLFGNDVGNDNICCCAKYLASADRPHGEWIVDTYNMELRCEFCGETFRFDDVDEVLNYMEYAKYCLACGAKMGGDGEV